MDHGPWTIKMTMTKMAGMLVEVEREGGRGGEDAGNMNVGGGWSRCRESTDGLLPRMIVKVGTVFWVIARMKVRDPVGISFKLMDQFQVGSNRFSFQKWSSVSLFLVVTDELSHPGLSDKNSQEWLQIPRLSLSSTWQFHCFVKRAHFCGMLDSYDDHDWWILDCSAGDDSSNANQSVDSFWRRDTSSFNDKTTDAELPFCMAGTVFNELLRDEEIDVLVQIINDIMPSLPSVSPWWEELKDLAGIVEFLCLSFFDALTIYASSKTFRWGRGFIMNRLDS